MEAAHGVKPETIKDKIKREGEEIKRKAGREFEHLPRNAQFAELRAALLKFRKQKGIAGDKAIRYIDKITKDLDEYEYEVFRYKVIFDDLKEDAKEGLPLPFSNGADGFKLTEEMIDIELANLAERIKDAPKAGEAIEKRHQVWQELKNDYIASMKKAGFNPEDRLTRENYYHHQVLEYAKLNDIPILTKGQIKVPTKDKFLRAREGTGYDINTDYLQAEFEVMNQMLYSMEKGELISSVKEHYDISSELKRQAMQLNENKMMEMFREMGQDEKYRQTLNREQAKGLEELSLMAARGELPEGPNGRYAKAVKELAKKADNITGAEAIEEAASNMTRLLDGQAQDKELFAYLNWLTKDEDGDKTGRSAAIKIFRGITKKKKMIMNTLANEYVDWQDLLPEGYSLWQPRKDHIYFLVNSIPETIAEALFNNIAEEIKINAEQVKKVLAVGKDFPAMVIPDEALLTLDAEGIAKPPAGVLKKVLTKWKQWQLISPPRYLKYNLRNMTGDLDAVLAGNPDTLKKAGRAFQELRQAFFTKDKTMTPELQDWFERGGYETLMQAQEINDVDRNRQFAKLIKGRNQNREISDKLISGGKKALFAWFDMARVTTDFREAWMRYATYLSYLEQIESNGTKPKNYGASIREEIDALSDNKDKAYKLANELMGAYDEVSVTGQKLADNLIPFWRWQEVNFVRYKRIIANALQDGKLMAALAGKTAGFAVRSPYYAYQLGRSALKVFAFSAVIMAFNALFFADEEEELPEDVKGRLHIIFGRNSDGTINYFSRLGALQDFADWFSLDTPVTTTSAILSGRKTLGEAAQDFVKAPVNKVFNALGPHFKLPTDFAGVNLYPDMFDPRTIRDRGEHIATGLGLSVPYRLVFGRPSRGGANALKNLAWYISDPYESAYWATVDRKYDFMEKVLGKPGGSASRSKKSDALYYYKMALRYKDKEAAKRYLAEYMLYGGSDEGLERSMASMDPLYGLSSKTDEQERFMKSLTGEEKIELRKAEKYYERLLNWTE
jgi:hypothetical protein